MTTHITKRCRHCGEVYHYMASSYGDPFPEHNDHDYCPDCKAVIDDALLLVPKRKEHRFVTVDLGPAAIGKLIDWYHEDEELKALERSLSDNLFTGMRRVGVPMFSLEDGDSTTDMFVKGRDELAGRTFVVTQWRRSGKIQRVSEEVEYDLVEDRPSGPWRDYR